MYGPIIKHSNVLHQAKPKKTLSYNKAINLLSMRWIQECINPEILFFTEASEYYFQQVNTIMY